MAVERRLKEASALRDFFHEQWKHLVKLLDVDEGEISTGQDKLFPISDAIDEMVAGTDARIRAVSHYQNRLRTGARKLLQHIDELVEQLAGPMKISRKGFVYDHQLSSLLGSMDEVKRLCEESAEVQEYLKSFHPGGQESLFALLFMRYHEKVIFGDELKGSFIHRDVRQISVYFSGHRLLAPAASEAEVKVALKHILFENVVEYLKLVLSGEKRYETTITDNHHPDNSIDSLNNPSRYLDELVTILELPLDLISLEKNTVFVNKMGIKVSGAERSCDEIHLQEVEIGSNHNNILALVEIVLSDLN